MLNGGQDEGSIWLEARRSATPRGERWCNSVVQRRATKGQAMWALVVFTFATSGAASGTVTTLEFNTQQLCLIAARELDALTAPVVSEGVARYKVLTTCVQTAEERPAPR